ncbi:MAG: hypothetical protein JO212_06010 [Acetobacteraceae bacterium]|nr:hypothetical protein [Acetobacteraceae bacterium]
MYAIEPDRSDPSRNTACNIAYVLSRLSDIAALGVDGIWIRNLSSHADFDRLVGRAHAFGLRVVGGGEQLRDTAARAHTPAVNAARFETKQAIDKLLEAAESWLRQGADGFCLGEIDWLVNDPAPLQPRTRALLGRLRSLLEHYPGKLAIGRASVQPGAFERIAQHAAGADHLRLACMSSSLQGPLDWSSLRHLIYETASLWQPETICWQLDQYGIVGTGDDQESTWHDAHPGAAALGLALLLSLPGSAILNVGMQFGERFGPSRPARASLQRFMAWRRSHPILRYGAIRPLILPQPMVGFERYGEGPRRILAVFNISPLPTRFAVSDYTIIEVHSESGFSPTVAGGEVLLPPYGGFFASVLPVWEWQEEAALAFV